MPLRCLQSYRIPRSENLARTLAGFAPDTDDMYLEDSFLSALPREYRLPHVSLLMSCPNILLRCLGLCLPSVEAAGRGHAVASSVPAEAGGIRPGDGRRGGAERRGTSRRTIHRTEGVCGILGTGGGGGFFVLAVAFIYKSLRFSQPLLLGFCPGPSNGRRSRYTSFCACLSFFVSLFARVGLRLTGVIACGLPVFMFVL